MSENELKTYRRFANNTMIPVGHFETSKIGDVVIRLSPMQRHRQFTPEQIPWYLHNNYNLPFDTNLSDVKDKPEKWQLKN